MSEVYHIQWTWSTIYNGTQINTLQGPGSRLKILGIIIQSSPGFLRSSSQVLGLNSFPEFSIFNRFPRIFNLQSRAGLKVFVQNLRSSIQVSGFKQFL